MSPLGVFGQFSSGSTGADGAFSPSSNQTLQLPESGVFNFTTVNVPTGVTITFLRNSHNTPVTMLASGNVTIAGTISVSGSNAFTNGTGGKGGPGGFAGGDAGVNVDFFGGKTGDGPGGGTGGNNTNNGNGYNAGGGGSFGTAGTNASGATTPYGQAGPLYGTYSLLPLTGGSGGGGGAAYTTTRGGGGGGGGGAILIASSGTISFTGSITAVGGSAVNIVTGGTGGGGSGGAVRIIGNVITGTGSIDVRGGNSSNCSIACTIGGGGGKGYIKAEAYDTSAFTPNGLTTPVNITLPSVVTVPNAAQLLITSIAGAAVPVTTQGSLFGAPDVVLPGSLANPVSIQIQASNLPVDSVVQVTVTPASGARTTFQSTPLSGTVNLSSATASINLPGGVSVITASLIVDLQVAGYKPMFIDGERIAKYEVNSTLGGKSETVFITATGKRLKLPESSR